MPEVRFAHETHVLYFRDALLDQLPSPYESNDVNRVTLAYFALSALDLLNALDQVPFRLRDGGGGRLPAFLFLLTILWVGLSCGISLSFELLFLFMGLRCNACNAILWSTIDVMNNLFLLRGLVLN